MGNKAFDVHGTFCPVLGTWLDLNPRDLLFLSCCVPFPCGGCCALGVVDKSLEVWCSGLGVLTLPELCDPRVVLASPGLLEHVIRKGQRNLWLSDSFSEPQGCFGEGLGASGRPPVGGQGVWPSPLPTKLLYSQVLHFKVPCNFCLKTGLYC